MTAQFILHAIVVLACGMLVITAIQVVGELPPFKHPATFAVWVAVALGAMSIAIIWRDMEPATALMLLLLSALIWSHRRSLASEIHEGAG